jgi:hypothetical protein
MSHGRALSCARLFSGIRTSAPLLCRPPRPFLGIRTLRVRAPGRTDSIPIAPVLPRCKAGKVSGRWRVRVGPNPARPNQPIPRPICSTV